MSAAGAAGYGCCCFACGQIPCRAALALCVHAVISAHSSLPACSGYHLAFNIPADGSSRGEREPLMAQARPVLVQGAPSFSRGYSTFFDA